MKKNLVRIILLCFITTQLFAAPQEEHAQSFMFTRPAYYHISTRQALWHNLVIPEKKGGQKASIQIIGIHQQSKEFGRTKRYFLPKRKDTVLIAGDNVTDDFFTRDMRAEWIGLPDTFRGTLTINPKQKQSGALIEYNQDLSAITDCGLLQDSWIAISAPVMRVHNEFNPAQCDITGNEISTEGPNDILQAFNQSSWNFSKFPREKQKETGLAEIRFELGTAFKREQYDQFAYYSFIAFPIPGRQDASYIFEPFVGNNRHFSIGGGILMQFLLNKNPERYAWSFFAAMEINLLFRNKQKRTLDLCEKPWSRFLPFNRKNGPPNENIPGVNVLTIPVVVRPYGMFDISIGWRVRARIFDVELSYNIWGHDREKLKLRDTFEGSFCFEEYGIAGMGTLTEKGQTVAASSSESTIDCKAADDTEFVTITKLDLDFKSGASASALNHKVQLAIGTHYEGKNAITTFGFGAFFDYPQKNAALRLWSIWLKGGASF